MVPNYKTDCFQNNIVCDEEYPSGRHRNIYFELLLAVVLTMNDARLKQSSDFSHICDHSLYKL